MPPPERSDSYPDSFYASSDADSASVASDTVDTFHSMNLSGFPDAKPRPKPEKGASMHSLTPSLGVTIDESYLEAKELPSVPNDDHIPIPHRDTERSRSPARHNAIRHNNGNRLRSPNPRNTSRSPARPERRTQLEALAAALGPDSVPHTAELDSIPCAGIRIPNGPFSGLLAWRLVVREHSPWIRCHTVASLRKEFDTLPDSDIRRKKNVPRLAAGSQAKANGLDAKKGRRMSDGLTNTFAGARSATQPSGHARPLSEIAPSNPRSQSGYGPRQNHFTSQSTASLPVMGPAKPRFHQTEVVEGDDDDWDILPPPIRPWDSSSTLVSGRPRSSSPSSKSRRPLSAIFNTKRHPDSPPINQAPVRTSSEAPARKPADAVVTNFLFDTSLGHNTISRETLLALGLGVEEVEGLEASELSTATPNTSWLGSEMTEAPTSSHHNPGESHGFFGGSNSPKTVSLYLQNATKPITFRLAPAGEPSRLGVQFLLETEVNVCTGDNGAAAIMWLDRPEKRGGRMSYHDVPRTVPLPKLSLKARVAKLFNLPA